MNPVDRTFLRARSSPFLYRFTLFTRCLLAAGFLPTGMVKLMGERFTTLGVDNPVGAFFEAMYQTGGYWRFIGLSQVVAAVLLLIPRYAHLGAAVFLPIMLNIVVITISVGFGGTPFVVVPMLVAVIYLCAWDYHRFRGLFTTQPLDSPVPAQRLDLWERVGFVVFAASLINFFGLTRNFFHPGVARLSIVTGLLAGLFTLGRYLWTTWGAGGRAALVTQD